MPSTDVHQYLWPEGFVAALHAYSPPLWRMGAYEIAETGELRRHSLSYAEELRPLD